MKPEEMRVEVSEKPSVLAIITARGGSERLSGKNLRRVGGRTLLDWTIAASLQAETIDRTILSSDDPEIIAAALATGAEVPFIRPPSLATAMATSADVVLHALGEISEPYDMFVLLQPTSPLRAARDIDGAVRLCVEKAAPSCVSVGPATKSPRWTYALSDNQCIRPLLSENEDSAPNGRKDWVTLNGAVYVARCDWFLHSRAFISPGTVGYMMPRERSIDIDDELDLVIAEALLAHRTEETKGQESQVRQVA